MATSLQKPHESLETDVSTFWEQLQVDARPCVFPALVQPGLSNPGKQEFPLDLGKSGEALFTKFSNGMQSSVENSIATAWAIVLKTYTANLSVSFGLIAPDEQQCPAARLCAVSVDPDSTLEHVHDMIERDVSRSISFQTPSISKVPIFRKPGCRAFCNTALNIASQQAQLDEGVELQLNFRLGLDRFECSFVYSGETLGDSEATHVALTFQQALWAMLSTPAKACAEIDLVHPKSLSTMLEWNGSVPSSVDRCVGELFAEQANLQPSNIAIHASDGHFTYAELAAMTNTLASDLQARGVGPESVVLLSFPKSAWAVVAMMAVIRAGGTMLFLDASHPLARLREIQSQVKAKIMLTAPKLADTWRWMDAEILEVDQSLLDGMSPSEQAISSPVTPDNMLYIIFTSGSTGKPKGCCIEHRQFLTGCQAQRKASGMLPADRVLQLASFTFDVSMLEIVTCLITGACVCIPGDADRAQGPAHCIQEFGVTWAFLTPSLVKLMAPEAVPTLRFLVLGGEPLSRTEVEIWAPRLQLANGYGPTECSIAATGYPNLSKTTDPANIGWPLGALCWLVDPEDHGRLVPPGAPGELLVHGPIVARGYFQDPVKTNAVFVDDLPWLPASRVGQSGRMYKTGDLARYNGDGTINFIGRKDSQVKLRGLRIELGDVEHPIAIHGLVAQAAVFLPREGPCKNQLTAVLALKEAYRESDKGSIEALGGTDKTACFEPLGRIMGDASQHLPAYMLPSVWIVVRSIPLTVSGKLNRVAMATWIADMDERLYRSVTGAESESTPVASTPTELQIQQLCADVLDAPISRVHLTSSFVNNGGDSILGMRLLAKLRAVGMDLSVKDMLESKSLVELAAKAKAGILRQSTVHPVHYDMDKFRSQVLPQLPFAENDIQEAYQLGPMQRGILLSQQKGSASYELRVVCEVSVPQGVVDIQQLQRAWSAVSRRHTSLRTIFTPSILDDAPCDQVVLKHVEPRVVFVTCQDKTEILEDVRRRSIVAAGAQPRVNLVIYNAPGITCCMAAVDHALIDGLSFELLFRDLAAAYAGSLDASQELRFSHYVGYVEQLDKTASIKYWKTYLEDLVPCYLQSLGDVVHQDTPNVLHLVLDGEMQVHTFCRHHNITPASLLQCAWAMTLKAYTGAEDVCFGYLTSGRDAPVANIEDSVGAYINMLVCRLRLQGGKTLLELVESVQDSFLNSLPFQHCSLAEIQHELGLQKPLFNTVMSLHGPVGQSICQGKGHEGISFRVLDEVDPTEYDISVNVAVTPEAVHVSLRHYLSKINHYMANRLLQTFKHAISTIIQSHGRPFEDAQTLSDHDREQIVSWNASEWEDYNACIHDEFEKQVAQRSGDVAIDAWDGSLTYGQLDDASSRLASYLSAHGVGPEILVPFCFDKSVWVPVVQLAILKAGGACVAMDAAYPSKRRQELLRRCEAKIVLTSRPNASLFEGLVYETLVVDEALLLALATDPSLPSTWTKAKPDNTAFVVFTSGSTGLPKGIVLEHHSLVASAHAHGPKMRYGPGQRILQFASYTFDVSIGETMSGLMLGATVCIPNDEERMSDLAGVINRMRINVLYLTPSVASLLHPSDIPGLEVLALGGEAVRAENITTWANKVYLVNIYGPAECSVWSTCLSPVPVGTSAANVGYGLGARTWITDSNNPEKLCSIGCVGELLLEGPVVARGYLNDVDKTKAAFIKDPLWMKSISPPISSGKTARTLYRTGDLARYEMDGSIHFIGRLDFQIKLHGQRIEMGDIEYHIQTQGSVANAVVMYPKVGPARQRLVAVIALREPTAADSRKEMELVNPLQNQPAADKMLEARTHLSERVPAYMMPATWLVVDFIPLSVNGKTDRSRISAFVEGLETIPETTPWDTTDMVVEPTTETEQVLRTIISEVLGIAANTTSMNKNFVGLGGDSITAMQVSSRCRTNAIAVTVKDVLLSKSIRQLAKVARQLIPESNMTRQKTERGAFALLSDTDLDQLDHEAKMMGLTGLEDVEDGYPTSPMQQGLLLAQAQASGNYKPYVICEVAATDGTTSPTVERLEAAWQRVVNRHPILRTVFVETGSTEGLFLQMVLKKIQARTARVDDLAALANYSSNEPTNYEHEHGQCPHRFTTCLGSDAIFFMLEISHTLIDGASMAIILKDLRTAYQKESLDPAPLYREYIALLQGQSHAQSLSYWREYLSGAESCTFPRLQDEPVAANTLEAVDVSLSPETVSKLHFFSKENGFTLANILQSAWALVLRAFTGSTDVLFGFMASGRDIPLDGIEEAVGPYINMLVCRVDASNHVRVLDTVRNMQTRYLNSLSHQHTPLAEIQHGLGLAGGRLFNTILSLQRPLSGSTDEDDAVSIKYLQGMDPTEYDLSVSITTSDSTIGISISFWSLFLSVQQASQVAATFSHILNQMLSRSTATLAELDFVCESDRQRIFAWNKMGVTPIKVDQFIHGNFARHATSQPGAAAISSWDGTLTYRELEEVSNRLSHYLRALGVTSEVMVPLCFDKSKWTVVAMLAVLRAGGAYVSMDPSHPTQHLANVVSQTQAKLVLTGTTAYADMLKKMTGNVVVINDSLLDELPRHAQPLEHVGTPDNAALISFTSGSTGKPKAICLTHSSFVSMVSNTQLGIGPASRVFQFAAHVFDTANLEIFGPLTCGGCVCIPSETDRLNDPAGAMVRHGVNWTFLTPSMASVLRPENVPSLQTLALCGEQAREDIVSTWKNNVRVLNSYGPAECTVCASGAVLGRGNSPATISRGDGGEGCLMWVVDTADVNKLAPVGAVGELLIEGPILARGYLDAEKTVEAFIDAPRWRCSNLPTCRMYRTGDLVRYHHDGALIYIGRADRQVKLNGQRIEMGEIERHVASHHLIQHAVVLLPQLGTYKRKLVAVVSLSEFSERTAASQEPRGITDMPSRKKAAAHVEVVKEQLGRHVPEYMVPTMWLVLESFPLTTSKKVDRVRVTRWVQDLSHDEYTQASLDVTPDKTLPAATTPNEERLWKIISAVLSIPLHGIDVNKSFLNLGGDSIQAMHLVVQCRKQGIKIAVKDIMRTKTLSSLALAAQAIGSGDHHHEELFDVPFSLSPIQSMYFTEVSKGSLDPRVNQFNQSFLLAVNSTQTCSTIANAVEQIVDHHPMLRARYRQNNAGEWSQIILSQTKDRYRFEAHHVSSREDALAMARQTQEQLDIQNGPVFSAEFFNISAGSEQLLFMVAHHLVVDLVSWRTIIRQVEEILTLKTKLPATKPFPFQAWVQAQQEHSRNHLCPESSLLHHVPQSDYSYWGMENQPNLRGDTAEVQLEMSQQDTDLLLRGCHQSMKTEALDIFLAAAFFSFSTVFSRPPPAIFNEGHGREPWDAHLDILDTVGWFTTMFPLHVSADTGTTKLDFMKQLKDQRRSLPRRGWAYFNSAVSNPAGNKAFASHWPVEILFNYHGVYQSQTQSHSLLQPLPFNEGDVGPYVRRFSLIEINAYVLQGKAHVNLTYNHKMKYTSEIKQWAASYVQTLVAMSRELKDADPILTIGDFPLLATSRERLERFQRNTLSAITSVDNVEDMVAASPMQEGILLGQSRINGAYNIEMIVEVSLRHGQAIHVQKLEQAWQMVVKRQAILRTVFVPNLSNRPYDQLVLKSCPAKVLVDESQDDAALLRLQNTKTLDCALLEPPHCMTILRTESGRVFCKLEISHALVDGTSTSILVSEWVQAYRDNLSALPVSTYSDYISYIHAQPTRAAMDHWTRYLADAMPCHMPALTDGEPSPGRQLHGVEVEVPNAARIRSFCQLNNVTLASIFRLAWAKVLRVFTGDQQVCFGYLASGREVAVPGIETAVGAFINMLICSVDFDHIGQYSVVDGLEMLQEEYVKSLPFQHIGLAQIQHELGISSKTLFNTVLSFQRRSHGNLEIGGVHLRYLDGVDPTEYDVSVSISDTEQEIHVHMSYFTDRLCDGQASNIAQALSNALVSILETPHAKVGPLSVFGARDAEQIALWNSQPWAPINKCVPDMLAENVLKSPGAVAIDSFEGVMTYHELDARATAVARVLGTLGVGLGSQVPIAFEKSPFAIVAMLGIMKAGAGFVPLDPAHPDDRLKTIISQTGTRLLLASEATTRRMKGLVDDVMTISAKSPSPTFGTTTSDVGVSPASTAYILFTSGSTGHPKGVVLSHVAVSSSITHHGREIGCDASTRMYQFAAYTFDASILEIFTTLAHGGCICVPSDAERMSDIAGFINRKRVNTAFMTPSLVRILKPEQVPGLQTLILGGEALAQDNIATWAGRVRLMNGYGPTETCVFAVMKTFHDPGERHHVLGKGVGSQTWIVSLDDPGQLAPIGAVGMLCLSGPALAQGYLDDKAKSDSVFIESPAFLDGSREGPRRVYNTGDLARYNLDGSITYLGRRDQQVKLRGQRIELSEIEHHVKSSLPQASQVAVEVVLPLGDNDKATLAAFICVANELEHDRMFLPLSDEFRRQVTRLQTALEALLPPYEVPSLFIPVDKMPTTTAGKLDRKMLRSVVADMSEEELEPFLLIGKSKRPLTTSAEKSLARLWAEVLKIAESRIGADDSFFRLGGDSIAAMKLAAQLTKGLSLTVSDIFQYPRLSDMAVVASKSPTTNYTNALIKPFDLLPCPVSQDTTQLLAAKCNVLERQIEDAYPCTPLQESLMALSMLHPGAYTMQRVFKLPKSIDMARFKGAWESTIRNNPILRTAIAQTATGRLVQVVVRDCFEWKTATSKQQYLKDDHKDGIAFGQPLSRYATTADGYFIWTAHHSMYDGWMVPLVMEQVRSYYTDGVAPTLPGFNTFIAHLSAIDLNGAEAYWRRYLSEGKPVVFPELPSMSHQAQVDNKAEYSVAIHRQADSEVPMATILRCAWAYVLSKYSDADDVVFGMTLSGRNCPVHDVAAIMGPTITTVPVRVRVPTEGTAGDFLQTVQREANEMMNFEHFGLQNLAKMTPEAARAVQFQNILVVQPTAQFDVQHGELFGVEDESEPLKNFDTYPLIMECSLSEGMVHLEARFDEGVISGGQIVWMLKHFEQVIHCFNNATAATRMDDISMFTNEDLSQVLSWNATYPDVLETSVPEVFSQQVQRWPDALAVDAWDGKLTYAELDRLSTALARHLIEKEGVGREVLVPICFEKSQWAIVTQLSIMKAGGAVVNLDAAHPLGRLQLILQDSKAKLLLVASQLYDKFRGLEHVKLVAMDDIFYRGLSDPLDRPNTSLPRIDPSSAAYVLFTSGSTGRPKGIVVEHRSLCSSSHAHGTAWDIGPATRLLQFAAYTFDVSCADIFTTLQRGGCVCVPSEHDRLNDLAGAINRFRCNWAFLTPTVASLLPADDIPSLKTLVLGGEACTRDTIAKWHAVLDLIVCYGPAECSVYCSGAPPASARSDPADLGGAIGARYWVVDAHDYNRLMPIGCTGELLLEGPTVARGYLDDDDKTAQAFVWNPAWAESSRPGGGGRRFYRTGDLVRFNDDGTIHFMGRKDTQVKVRGQRVELGEIEHAIRVHMPSLTHVTVDAVRFKGLDNKQMVVAFLHMAAITNHASDACELVSLHGNPQLKRDLVKLNTSLATVLPSHMLPNLFIPMTRVPLTMNGKIDRRRLGHVVSGFGHKEVLEYGLESPTKRPPSTSMEFALRDLWAHTLGVDAQTIGVEDQFFRIGGDSILAMKLVGAAAKTQIPIVVRDFFHTPVLSDLAKALDNRTRRAPKANGASNYEPFSLIKDTHPVKLVRDMSTQIQTDEANIADVLPATDFQQTAVAHALIKTRGFRNYLWLDGTGSLDTAATEKALEVFVADNAILRTVFALHHATIVQVVVKVLNYKVEWHQTSTPMAAVTERICKADMASPTKLTDALLKFIVVQSATDHGHRIILRISHAQYDGLSLPQLWRSLAAALEGRPTPEPTQPMSTYLHAVNAQHQHEALHHWRSLLAGSNMTAVVSHKRPSHRNVYNRHLTRAISTPSLASLEHGNTTFATVLKAAWALVLAALTSTPDVLFGHVVSGRTLGLDSDMSAVAGPVLNIVPVRVQLMAPNLSSLQVLQAVQSQHAAGLPYEGHIGTRTIVRQCAPSSWPSYTRFSSIVQHQNIQEETQITVRGAECQVGYFCPQADEADVAVKTTPRRDGTTEVLLICSDGAVGEELGSLLLHLLCRAVEGICAAPGGNVDQLVKTLGAGREGCLPLRIQPDLNGCRHAGNHAGLKTVNGGLVSVERRETMEKLVAAWREVLGLSQEVVEKLDGDADFFELGGDLVSAAVLAAKLQMDGVGLVEVERIIDRSTLAEMAEILGRT